MLKVAAIGLCASFAMQAAAMHSAQAQTRIAIGTPPIAEVEATFVAQDLGYFERNGLVVDLLPTGTNPGLVAAVVSGSHQIVSVSPTVLLQAIDSGLDLVAVAHCGVTSKRTAKNMGLAVHEGVAIANPRELAGKKIGVPGIGGTLDVIFRQWLKQRDVDMKAVTFIEVAIPSTADVLRSRNIEGIIAGQPSLGRAIAASNGRIAFHFMEEMPENLPFTGFVATRAWAAKNPETIAKFRKAMAEAAAFVKGNEDKTRELVSKYTKLPMELLRTIELPECNPTPSVAQFAFFDQAMRDQGLLQNKIDLAGVIAP
ncbi:MAG: NitT/TauT family transport system substrate-binding protein [Hyphomicrobiales bacterium]|jgi:NitT/TauT family transport system substrate-binding protein|nr:NitT/TauT family transport system substrate-binding protein [Hyphomicrobiales bacterium]